jgi:hypothetical protein
LAADAQTLSDLLEGGPTLVLGDGLVEASVGEAMLLLNRWMLCPN